MLPNRSTKCGRNGKITNMVATILVYSPRSSPRLTYVLDWLLKERLQLDYSVTNSLPEAGEGHLAIAYGSRITGMLCLPDAGLLWQEGVTQQVPIVGEWKGLPTVFATSEEGYTLSFDVFSAAFFLLSRYEEYYTYQPDKHGRYPATASLLYQKGWLARPLLDEWVHQFRKQLQGVSGIPVAPPRFVFKPTYDIDIAFSHLHKGWYRILGAYVRALLRMDIKQMQERTQVLKKKQKDPFDSFRLLRQLHQQYHCEPTYFVLSALKTTPFDKNIHPRHPAMVRVIKQLAKDGTVGIHPSYYSDQGNIMQQETDVLQQVAEAPIAISRQHYIRFRVPDTYRQLLRQRLLTDYSMGYGTHLGFRAGTGNPFLWYDITAEVTTSLRIYPFCFMDTTAHYELKLTASQAFGRLADMSRLLEKTGSCLITIFHNFSLGTSKEWKGWREAYEHFMQEKSGL